MSGHTHAPAGEEAIELLRSMGIAAFASRDARALLSPIDESPMPGVPTSSTTDVGVAVEAACRAFLSWRNVPAPVRGELVRLFGLQLRAHKSALGRLVTLEVGKPLSEGVGEVQEMIDICDFAVGLSRQLYGLTIASERPEHHMREMWHPLGPVGIITMRRLIVHEDISKRVIAAVKRAYTTLAIDDPRSQGTHSGPLIDQAACEMMEATLSEARADGGQVFGGTRFDRAGFYVSPALVEMPAQTGVVKRETFAPILYVLKYRNFDDALHLLQDVPQGLSSSILTNSLREAEIFLSAKGSDCGIANVNMGTSGAEIGGAFGGEKETGGGRESGSDSWKAYMRRQTQTVNYGMSLPLAQGVEFDV
jgi:acyl-CoA reductase-like NAD-dependent aldehyde dehydrogenase